MAKSHAGRKPLADQNDVKDQRLYMVCSNNDVKKFGTKANLYEKIKAFINEYEPSASDVLK